MNEEISAATAELRRAAGEAQAAAAFFTSNYFEERIAQAIDAAVTKANGPWLNRAAAAAYCHCGTSEIDVAADAGVFKRYHRGGSPIFRKDEIDAAIKNGKWPNRAKLMERKAA